MPRSIAVAGKGGTGKTTIAALIIQSLCEAGEKPILAIDADPDSNLGGLLGIVPGKTVGDLREEILKGIKNFPAGMDKAQYVAAGMQGIIEEADGFDLLSMGRGEGPGCYCALNNMIRRFTDDLTPNYRWVVMDNEAGLEHLSRRTTSNVDALIVVVNANPVSIETASKIVDIARSIKNKIGRMYAVSNIVRPDRAAEIEKRISSLQIEYLGAIPADEKIEEAMFNRGNLKNLNGSIAKDFIKSLLKKIGGNNGAP
jgi:CO dehydrogenase maturation factor